jgi:signal transduction histidine kinase
MMQLKPLNFLPIVTTTVEMYMAQAQEKNITVTVESTPPIPPVMGSSEHLESMVGNLVSNAVRYTPDNGSVTVKVGAAGKWVVLMVADTGIGIPEEAMPKLFTEFYRASNARKMSSMGSGIGMSIVKKIVDEHGGSIDVRSQEGEGTAFTVRLPAAPQPG